MRDEEAGGRGRAPGKSPLVVVLAAVGLLGLGTALLAPTDVADGGSAVGLVVGHPVVVGSLRALVVALALFLTASAVARALEGHWVRRVGPVDASAEVDDVTSESTDLRGDLARAEAEVTRLASELAAALELLDDVAHTPGAGQQVDPEERR